MAQESWLACLAFVAAFFVGACLCVPALRGARSAGRSIRSLRNQGDEASRLAGRTVLLRNGVPLLAPAAQRLLRNGKVRAYMGLLLRWCRGRGLQATDAGLLSVLCLGAAVLIAAGFLAGSPLLGPLLSATAALVAGMVAKQAREAERDALRDAVPGVLRSMSACFHAGYTLLQTFHQVASESKGDISRYFERAAAGLETGKTASQVLGELRNDADLTELGFVIVALEVQHRTGGSLRQIIETACEAVDDELALRRSLRVQTAQARLSARVVTVMPFALMGLLSLMTEDFLAPFFASATGFAVLILALGMQVVGVLAVRKLLEVGDG